METKCEKIDSSGFVGMYNECDNEKKKKLATEICKVCGISVPTFYYKNRTKSWRCLELRAIEEVLSGMQD